MVEFHYLAEGVPTTDRNSIYTYKPDRDRAQALSPFTAEIAAANPEVAQAVAELDAAIAAIRAEVDRMDDLVVEYEEYQEAARAGQAERYLPDSYFQARADAIRDAHVEAVRSAVLVQNNVVRLSRPYENAFLAADRKRIRDIADELALLIQRSTRWSGDTVVVLRRFERVAPVRDIIDAIRHIGTVSPSGHPYESEADK